MDLRLGTVLTAAFGLALLPAPFLAGSGAEAAEPALWTTVPQGKRRKSPLADLADRARPAVVHVRGLAPPDESGGPSPGTGRGRGDVDRMSIGTGFIVHKDGYVVTNEHVVRGVTNLRVRLYDGRELGACVLGADTPTDIALLRVEASGALPVLPLGDSDAVRVGDPVVAIGNPFGFNNSVTAGIVSAKERVVDRSTLGQASTAEAYSFFIQTDASINLGNSGGPLIDEVGEVIGVNAAFWAGHPMQPAQGIGFAIPINMAKALLPRLKERGSAPRAFLGVDAQPIDASLAEGLRLPSTRGALLASVEKASPAEEAGLEPGDVVVSWGPIPIATSEDLKIDAQLSAPGSRVKVTLIRGGKRLEREVAVRAAAARAPAAAPHPSACSQLPPGPAGRSEELVVTELPPARAAALPGGRGVSVAEVPAQSAAADAGLRVGDVILRVGKDGVGSAADVTAAVKRAGGSVIPVLVRRSGYDFWTALRRR
jgi:serine protease Do